MDFAEAEALCVLALPAAPLLARHFTAWRQQVQDLQSQSSSWALSASNYLTQLEDYQRHVTKLIGPRTKARGEHVSA